MHPETQIQIKDTYFTYLLICITWRMYGVTVPIGCDRVALLKKRLQEARLLEMCQWRIVLLTGRPVIDRLTTTAPITGVSGKRWRTVILQYANNNTQWQKLTPTATVG